MIHGHKEVLALLEPALPPVVLFTGPKSVGKWATAEHLRRHHGIEGMDIFRTTVLTAERARALVSFLAHSPITGKKIAIVRLEKASVQAYNALLKSLEELPDGIHVILICERPDEVPATILSRSEHYRFGYLNATDLQAILVTSKRLHPEEAESLAMAGGSIDQVLPDPEKQEAKQLVVRALYAMQSHDAKSLDALSVKWTDTCTEVLRIWCTESLSQRWKLFAPEESELTATSTKLRILLSLKSNIRPRLVVRSTLMNLLTQGV